MLVFAVVGLAWLAPINHDTAAQQNPGQSKTQPERDPQPLNLESIQRAINEVSRAIEALKADEQSEEQESRAKRDLDAQERMAYWAEYLYYAALASLVLTFIGLVLLAATLVYTRRAAQHSKEMANTATEATLAAKEQAEISKQSFRRLERPYVIPGEIGKITLTTVKGETRYYVSCTVGNYGRTPAILHYIRSSFGPNPMEQTSDPQRNIHSIDNDFNYGRVLAPGDPPVEYPARIPEEAGAQIDRKGAFISPKENGPYFFVINTKFGDTLGVIREGRFTWKYDERRRRFLRYSDPRCTYEREKYPT